MVAGAGASDVEEADPFVVAHLLVDGLPGVELLGGHILAELVAHGAPAAGEVDVDGVGLGP